MHEILTISVGHRPNHLATQFFNCQEQLLSNLEEKVSDPSIFLQPTIDRVSRTVSYAPRALLWDSRAGNGALGTYQYHGSEDYFYTDNTDNNAKEVQSEVIVTHPRVAKAQYQTALDSGASGLPKLSPGTAKYWSDYAKLIYPSTSFNYLRDWYHDTSKPNVPHYQKFESRRFDSHEIGYQELNDNYATDFFDGNLHAQLEQCDTLQGLNLITDMDSGWGGFSSALLLELRNELPKASIITWGYYQDDPLTAHVPSNSRITKSNLGTVRNKIRSTVSLSEESDLVVPLYADSILSNWEQAGLSCKIYDTLNSLACQSDLQKRRSLENIISCLTLSDSSRNFVSSITGAEVSDSSFFSRISLAKSQPRSQHVFDACRISRQSNSSPSEVDSKNSTMETYPYAPSDTIPEIYSREKCFSVEYSSTEICRNVFMQYEDVVSRYFRHDSDREELKDSLATMKSSYEYGWYDDEFSGDDDM